MSYLSIISYLFQNIVFFLSPFFLKEMKGERLSSQFTKLPTLT